MIMIMEKSQRTASKTLIIIGAYHKYEKKFCQKEGLNRTKLRSLEKTKNKTLSFYSTKCTVWNFVVDNLQMIFEKWYCKTKEKIFTT